MKKDKINKNGNLNNDSNNKIIASEVINSEITKELESSYLDYAMSVIVSRALPDVRDGLKPVHRRILWAMWNSGLTHNAKYRKSANVVGEVLGKYHPHGDSSVYDAMVRMAQDFSLRYPLIDGQGNWGSIDGDSAAAMRYSEARLSKISSELLFDIEKETVDFIPNYDGTKLEPVVLPAKIPNLLLNGAVGIAVGMATDIPPHNLNEVVDAIIYLIHNPDATVEDLTNFVKGPDFPTGGIIYDKSAIIEAYKIGQGGIVSRGKAEIVEKKENQFSIVISEIPYRVNKADLVQKIAQLIIDKKIEGVKDLRDESDREGLSIVLDLKQDVSPNRILNKLYKYTELQKNFHLNMIALVDGIQPQLLSLKEILQYYLKHRQNVVKRRTEFELKKAKERAHILEGLVKALNDIDNIIATIKKSKDKNDARKNLIVKFKLTEIQANAILEMKLQTLASLERKNIEEELIEKKKLIKQLESILSSKKKMLNVIEEELKKIKDVYGDERRTKVISKKLSEFKDEDLIPEEETIITITQKGYIKRSDPNAFKVQKRGGKGLIGSSVKEGDLLKFISIANTHDNILFFTNTGKVFQTKVYEIPYASRTSKGKLVQNFLDIPSSENVEAIVSYNSKKSNVVYLLMATENGLVKKTSIKDFANVRRSGIIAIKLKNGDNLKKVIASSGNDQVLIITKYGKSIRFSEKDLRPMGRSASGVKGINLKKNDKVVSMDILSGSNNINNKKVLIVTENGYAKQTLISEYRIQSRGGTGIKTAQITSKNGYIVASRIISDEENLIVLSTKGQIIKIPLNNIRTIGRSTAGVRIMKLNNNDNVAAITCL